MDVTTAKDILQLALPRGSVALTGITGLDRTVNWVSVLSAYPPVPDDVSAGDLVLMTSTPLLISHDTMRSLLEDLARVRVAAIGVVGEIPAPALASAKLRRLPILAMPAGTRLAEVERSVAALIFNRQAELEQRGVQIYRQLAQMVTSGRGIGAIVDQLAEITGKLVTLQNPDFTLSFYAGPLIAGYTIDDIRTALHEGRQLQSWLQGVPLVSTAPPIGRFDLPLPDLARYVAPVTVDNTILAYVSVIGRKAELTELDRVASGRAASVSALELAKERAVVEAENKVRDDFLEDLLNGNFLTEEAMVRRGARLGYDLNLRYAVAVLKSDLASASVALAEAQSAPSLDERIAGEVAARVPGMMVHTSGDMTALLWPVGDDDIIRIKERVEALRRDLAAVLGGPLSAGVGRISSSARDLPRSYREATQAVSVAQNLLGGSRTAYTDDLLVYRLLFPLQGSRELLSFYQESIGRLVEHDQKRGAELVKTLDAFFQAHGNVNRTAEMLFLHRNAVAYRLKRIEDITGLSLDDSEHRLALHLGLKVRNIV